MVQLIVFPLSELVLHYDFLLDYPYSNTLIKFLVYEYGYTVILNPTVVLFVKLNYGTKIENAPLACLFTTFFTIFLSFILKAFSCINFEVNLNSQIEFTMF